MEKISIQQILTDQLSIPIKLLTSFKDIGLNENDVMVILQIHRFINNKNDFPTPTEISSSLSLNEKECALVLRKLIQKGLLAIEQLENEHGQLSEAYSLASLWEKLYTSKPEYEEQNIEGTIFLLFEQEFGRPLSPFEIETINNWLDIDQISSPLIKAALREAVLMGKLNFKYIDRILHEWQKKGIRSVEQARQQSKMFRNQQTNPVAETKKRDTSFYYNWLEGED